MSTDSPSPDPVTTSPTATAWRRCARIVGNRGMAWTPGEVTSFPISRGGCRWLHGPDGERKPVPGAAARRGRVLPYALPRPCGRGGGGISVSEAARASDGKEDWRSLARRVVHELYVYDRATRVVADAYFKGQQVLFPDSAETLTDVIGRIETLIEMDNHDIKTSSGKRSRKTAGVDLAQVEESAQEDGKILIDEIVVMGEAEALEICGERRDSVLLVRNHLDAALGGSR